MGDNATPDNATEEAGSNARGAAQDQTAADQRRRAKPRQDTTSGPGARTTTPPNPRPSKRASRRTGYAEIAEQIREQINSGRLPPSAPLPSQTEIRNTYGVSHDTARSAIAALRSQGLITVIHGKGSFVRRTGRPAHTDQRTITRTSPRSDARANDGTHTSWDGAGNGTGGGPGTGRGDVDAVGSGAGGYVDADADRWRAAELQQPSMYHINATAELALSVGVAEHTPLIGIDRFLEDPTGRRMLHKLYLPGSTVADLPALEKDPYIIVSRLYTELAAAGHQLIWTEYVTARMPSPDDAKALRIPHGTPLIATRRVTRDTNGQPLAMEETHRSAEDTQLAYTITPEPNSQTVR